MDLLPNPSRRAYFGQYQESYDHFHPTPLIAVMMGSVREDSVSDSRIKYYYEPLIQSKTNHLGVAALPSRLGGNQML